jgi:hypothetical protein
VPKSISLLSDTKPQRWINAKNYKNAQEQVVGISNHQKYFVIHNKNVLNPIHKLIKTCSTKIDFSLVNN